MIIVEEDRLKEGITFGLLIALLTTVERNRLNINYQKTLRIQIKLNTVCNCILVVAGKSMFTGSGPDISTSIASVKYKSIKFSLIFRNSILIFTTLLHHAIASLHSSQLSFIHAGPCIDSGCGGALSNKYRSESTRRRHTINS